MLPEILADAKTLMGRSVEATERDLTAIRSGRASTGLVDHVRVEVHGSPTPINHLATVNVPEPRLLTIQPWDRSTLGAIEKAIQKSDLGINPSNDGSLLRLVLPPLTEQRRKELVKIVAKRIEEGRVAARNVRREASERIKKSEKNKELSADEARRGQEQLQKLTDATISEIEKLGRQKEQELLEV